ncbi:MAG: META domain-containing protein [Calothrix sp. MO_167.B42]|nr:META domain-containing protein [Calothrix sp. MO_167.B42]
MNKIIACVLSFGLMVVVILGILPSEAMALEHQPAQIEQPTAVATLVQVQQPPKEPLQADQGIRADATVSGCSPTNELMGEHWELWEIRYNNGERIKVNQPHRYTLEFICDANVKIRADCNRARGTYTLNGSQLTIQIGAMTKVACPPDSIADRYLHDLGAAANYFIQDGQLYIDLRGDVGTMVFASIQI